ncbi:hypothetical protein ACFE04_010815 [Oxalis oulophora]
MSEEAKRIIGGVMGKLECSSSSIVVDEVDGGRNSFESSIDLLFKDLDNLAKMDVHPLEDYLLCVDSSLEVKAQKALELCPCIADLRNGACGDQFSATFLCFLKSTTDEKPISLFLRFSISDC